MNRSLRDIAREPRHDIYWRKEQKALKQAGVSQIVTMKCLTWQLQEFINRGWAMLGQKTTGGGYSTTFILQIDRQVLEARS